MKRIITTSLLLALLFIAGAARADNMGNFWVLFVGASCLSQDMSFADTLLGRAITKDFHLDSKQPAEGRQLYDYISFCTMKRKMRTPGVCKAMAHSDLAHPPKMDEVGTGNEAEFATLGPLMENDCGGLPKADFDIYMKEKDAAGK